MNFSEVNIFILIYLTYISSFHYNVYGCSSKRISCITETSYKFCFIVGDMVMEIGNIKYCPEHTICDETEGTTPCFQKVLYPDLTDVTVPPEYEIISSTNFESIEDIFSTEEYISESINDEETLSSTVDDGNIELSEQEEIESNVPMEVVLEEISTSLTDFSSASVTDSILDEPVTITESHIEALSSKADNNKIDFSISKEVESKLTTLSVNVLKKSSTYATEPSTVTSTEEYLIISTNPLETINYTANYNENEFLEISKQKEESLLTRATENVPKQTIPAKYSTNGGVTVESFTLETTTSGIEENLSVPSGKNFTVEPLHFKTFFDEEDNDIDVLTTEINKGMNIENPLSPEAGIAEKFYLKEKESVKYAQASVTPGTREPKRTTFQDITTTEKFTTAKLEIHTTFTTGTTVTTTENQSVSTEVISSAATSESPIKRITSSSVGTKHDLPVTSTEGTISAVTPIDKTTPLSAISNLQDDNIIYEIKKARPTLYLGIIGLLTPITESTTQTMCQTTSTIASVPNFKTDLSTTTTSAVPYTKVTALVPNFRTDFSTTTTTSDVPHTKAFLPICKTTGRYPSKICNQYYECVRIMWWLQVRIRTCHFGQAFNSVTLTCRRDSTCRGVYR